ATRGRCRCRRCSRRWASCRRSAAGPSGSRSGGSRPKRKSTPRRTCSFGRLVKSAPPARPITHGCAEGAAVGRRFENLQVLRGVAALLIVGFHVAEWETRYGVRTPVVRGLSWYGGLGIDLFFALSGFIIAHAHFDQLGRPRAAPRYLARRLWRILPTYWVMMLAAAALGGAVLAAPVFAPGWETRWLYWLTLQPGGPPNALIPPAWSLVYEMAFYLMFALLFLVPRRAGFALFALWGATIVAAPAAGWQAASPYPALLLSPLILEFLFGCAAAVLVVRGCTGGGRSAVVAGVVGCAAGVLTIHVVTNGSGNVPLLPRMLWFGPCCALV